MKIHIVKIGETLYHLGKKYGVELTKLIAANPHILNQDEIQIGTKVKVPAAPKPLEPAEGTYTFKHVVKQGDTLWKLSKAWDVPLADVIAANPHLKNPNVLLTGEVVYIPKKEAEAEAEAAGHPAELHNFAPPTIPQEPTAQLPASGTLAVDQSMPVPPWGSMEPGFQTGYPPGPQESPVHNPGSFSDAWSYEPLMPHTQQMPQAPLLTEPFAGVQGWEQQAVNPFAQANIPAAEAFASQYPELPHIPQQPFEPYMSPYGSSPYGSYPYHAASVYQELPQAAAYAYAGANPFDCCSGPYIQAPYPYGGVQSGMGAGALSYAAPLTAPYASVPPVFPHQPYPPYSAGIPAYPPSTELHAGDGAKIEEKEQEFDLTLDQTRVKTKSVSSAGKRAKPLSQHEQLSAYLQSIRHRVPSTPRRQPNLPWINV